MDVFEHRRIKEIAIIINQKEQFVKNRSFRGRIILREFIKKRVLLGKKNGDYDSKAMELFDYRGYLVSSSLFNKEKVDTPRFRVLKPLKSQRSSLS